jgi:thiamine biosynthesis lipoprotein
MRPALGTFVEVRAASVRTSEKLLEKRIELAFARIAKVEKLMSFHSEKSDLGRLNRAKPGRWIRVHPWTARVLRQALALQRDSDGIFDVAIAGRASNASPDTPSAPSFEVRRGKVRRLGPNRIDLGGIAKGFAVDQAIEVMSKGFRGSGLVSAGGDLRAFGSPPSQILVRTGAPDRQGALSPLSIQLRSGALATSHSRPDKVLTRSGKPLKTNRTVSILAPNCMIADGLTKVALMAKPALAQRCLEKHGACLIRPDAVAASSLK